MLHPGAEVTGTGQFLFVIALLVSPGIEPGYIDFPSHKKTMYIFSKAYCYFDET
jgi:hypothetical protein